MHPADAIHGDLGMVAAGDVVLAVSASGETEELLRLLEWIRRLGASLISMTGNPASTLASQSDLSLDISISEEACPMGLAPTASTTAALAMGDALAVAVYTSRGFGEDDFARFHPGGQLGRRVLKVEQVMHTGGAVPIVPPGATVRAAIEEMSSKRLGCTLVADSAGELLGLFTDGDLRRLLQKPAGAAASSLDGRVEDHMTTRPVTIGPRELASRALLLMEERKITSIPVVDPGSPGGRRVGGIVQLHDLWRVQLF
jgi:arabinose-5-phosphate isomerase